MSRRLIPSSFRGRFLLVVVLAAVLPLGLIGAWLTRSVARAGEDLLRSELTQSLEAIAAPAADRWQNRMAELLLLANNEAGSRAVGTATQLGPADSAYLAVLFSSLAKTIPAFEYRDASGRTRWASPVALPDTSSGSGLSSPVASPATMTVRLPVGAGPAAAPGGELIAQVALTALVPIDTSLRLPNGAELQVVQRETGRFLMPTFTAESLAERDRLSVGGADWLAVRRSLSDPPLDLVLAGPLAAYVRPFASAARTGMVTLAVAALLVLLVAGYLTFRLTGSLKRLAVAADRVAAGDLEHRVEGKGADEIGRVAAAFNGMVENLRRTLNELGQRQALAAMGEYAATLSHEVRNGLTAIRVDLQRAEEKTVDGAEVPGGPLVVRALENLKRLDGIVSRSLQLSRSGREPRRRLDLRSVLATAAQGAEASFSDRGAALERTIPGGTPSWVMGDALALEQLFLNLLLNAAQALPPGGGGSASIVVEADGADARVVVSDTGAGIAPADLVRVLEPFYSTKADGTGLGLPIARQIAAAHGGSLRIESTEGQGTRIEVRLPLAGAPVSARGSS